MSHKKIKSMVRIGVVLLFAAVSTGCARYPSSLKKMYGELAEGGALRSSGVLKGRRIVIDPGHGGYFDGVIGADSLREADANLGVALYLWGLLKDAGAEAFLTRTTDRDFLPPGSVSLTDDLLERIKKANEFEPEVFISIHHNSVLPMDRRKNRIELYYKSSDTEGSLVLANDVAVHLARNLGIDEMDVRPGDYFVLRKSTARLSILGEASYLSNPWVEKKLKLSEKQKLEAQAYFLGLIDYFTRGVPLVKRVLPVRDTVTSSPVLEYLVEEKAGVPIDPKTASVKLGNRTYRATYLAEGNKLALQLPRMIPNGTYNVTASISSVKRGLGRSERFKLTVARPPGSIVRTETCNSSDGSVGIGFRILDNIGLPVIDGTDVTVEETGEASSLSGKTRNGFVRFSVRPSTYPAKFIVRAGSIADTFIVGASQKKAGITIIVRDAGTGKPVPYPVAAVQKDTVIIGDSAGRIMTAPLHVPYLTISAQGYNSRLIKGKDIRNNDEMLTVRLRPIFSGILRNIRVSLDPAGMENSPSITGKDFTREAFVNLIVVRFLRDLLMLGGADVLVTRQGEGLISLQERVAEVNRFKSDLAVRINHSTLKDNNRASFLILHYPGSKKGKSLACSLANQLNELYDTKEFECRESARIFLLQTHCPAIEIFSAPIEDGFYEAILSNPEFLRREAEMIFKGILHNLVPDSTFSLSSCRVLVKEKGTPLAGAVVTVNHSFSEKTDEEGMAEFILLDPGVAVIQVEKPDGERAVFTAEITEGGYTGLTLELE